MKGFCQHCGRELNGDEPRCPECGMPTGIQTAYYAPLAPAKNNGVVIAVVVIAVLIVGCAIGIAVLSSLVTNEEKYDVTFTVESVSIELDDLTQWDGASTKGDVYLELYYVEDGETHHKEVLLYKDYVVNSGEKSVNKEITIRVSGDLKNKAYSAYLEYQRTYPGAKPGDVNTINDLVDIYSVDTSKITGESKYYGDTGVSFTADDFSSNSTRTFKGDSDPVGKITIGYKAVKI